MNLTPKYIKRFWSKVNIGGADSCWQWKAGCFKDTHYGAFWDGRNLLLAHRFSYATQKAIPKGLCVLHECDNRKCVNPKHLFVGTKKDNALDCVAKGRNTDNRGSRNGQSKLTEKKVKRIKRLIRSGNYTMQQIANIFGVSHGTILSISSGKNWGWLRA